MIDAAYIQLAIGVEDVIEFSYPSSEDGRPLRRTFSPWMIEKDGTIVKGWDHGRDAIRRYAIAQIDDADILLDEDFVHPL